MEQDAMNGEAEPISEARSKQIQAGDVLGSYQMLCPVARGGMGEVWAARRTGRLGVSSLVAVKVALAEQTHQQEKLETLFYDEGRVAASIDHPNVCKTYELGDDGGVLFLAMEFIDGASLLELVRSLPSPRRMNVRMAAHIVAQACSGLHAAHELKDDDGVSLHVVHRDATPQNILITSNGDVKVVDFGVAKARNQVHATVAGEFKGKINYLAPEQILSKGSDRRTDVFALGCVLYLITTGERPFHADSAGATMHQIISNKYELPSTLVADYPPELEAVIVRALAANPADRFQTAEELRVVLETFARGGPTEVFRDDLAKLVRQQLGAKLEHRRGEIRAAQRSFDTQGGTRDTTPPSISGVLSLRPLGAEFTANSSLPPVAKGVDHSSTSIGTAGPVTLGVPPRSSRSVGAILAVVAIAAVAGVALLRAPTAVSPPSPAAQSAALPGAQGATTVSTLSPDPLATRPSRNDAPASVAIVVTALPPHALVSLDGSPAYLAPHTFTVPRDDQPHALQARAEKFGAVSRTVSFASNQTIHLVLAPKAQAPARAPSPRAAPAPNAGVPSAADDAVVAPLPGARARRSIDESDPFRE